MLPRLNCSGVRVHVPAAAPLQVHTDPACESCLLSMHILDDVLCDPYVDDQAVC